LVLLEPEDLLDSFLVEEEEEDDDDESEEEPELFSEDLEESEDFEESEGPESLEPSFFSLPLLVL
jgi:hypothetical protein